MNFLAFIFGFCSAYFILKRGININIKHISDNVFPESTFATPIDQYEQFKKSEVDDKDVNNVAQEDKEDISRIFKLFNGGE